MKNKFRILIAIVSSGLIFSCASTSKMEKEIKYSIKDAKSMVMAVEQTVGGQALLKAQKDVSFDYYYLKPDGKKDISQERYIFEEEISWANYSIHQENVSPELEGNVIQYYDGKSAAAYHKGNQLKDPAVIGTSQFLRQANYMWFTMFYKLTDPGTVHKYDGKEEMNGKTYDVVTVTYDPVITGKEVNDTYILYIDPATKMVDYFKFSLPAMGIKDAILLAKLTYTEINGLQIVTRREMFVPTPDGTMAPMVDQVLKEVKFNNGFTPEKLAGMKM